MVLNLDRAHICAHDPSGPRFDPLLTNPDGWENLILLCKAHHKAVDTWVTDYPVNVLLNWKKEREADLGETSETLDRLSDKQFESRITGAFEVGMEGVRDAIAEIKGLNEEQIRMLQGIADRYFETPEVDADSAWALASAAHILDDINLGDYAPMLLRGASAMEDLNLAQLSYLVERLENASDLEEHTIRLESAARAIDGTLDQVPHSVSGFDEAGTGIQRQINGASARISELLEEMDQRIAELAAQSTRLVDADHGNRMLKLGFSWGIGLCVGLAILIGILVSNG